MKSKKQIREEAIRWFLWLRENKVDAEGVDVFNRWLSINNVHKQAYREIESVLRISDALTDLPWPLPEELMQDHYDGSYPLPTREGAHILMQDGKQVFNRSKPDTKNLLRANDQLLRNRRFERYGYSIAASLFLILSTVIIFNNIGNQPQTPDAYYTSVGQQENYSLNDGSIITLGPKTRILVEFNKHQRFLRLLQGEAYFDVAKDLERPFIVQAGVTTVEAVGTSFNVNRRSNSVVVSVVEGVVRLASSSDEKAQSEKLDLTKSRLMQGEEAVYEQDKTAWVFHQLEPRSISWREGSLAYVNERLDKVVEDINRYSHIKLVVGDQDVANLVFTGTVLNHQISDWVKGLERTFPVRLLEFEDRIVLLSPLSSPDPS